MGRGRAERVWPALAKRVGAMRICGGWLAGAGRMGRVGRGRVRRTAGGMWSGEEGAGQKWGESFPRRVLFYFI